MSRCMKTGTVIKLPEYGAWIYADMHGIPEDVAIIRFKDFQYHACAHADYSLRIMDGYYDDRGGIIVVPFYYLEKLE